MSEQPKEESCRSSRTPQTVALFAWAVDAEDFADMRTREDNGQTYDVVDLIG